MSVICNVRGCVTAAAVTIGVFAAGQNAALAWGSTGHRIIGVLAIRDLPTSLPEFIRSDDTVWQVGELAREPDRSRGSGDPHDRDLDPGHFVDASDDLKVLEGPSLSALPATREDYDTALRAAKATEYKAGYLPYSIIDGWQQLVKDFAYWRVDAAGEKFAKTDEARAWYRHDRVLREAITIRDLGYWSHFVGDASQPMHVSVHYDGWGNFPNPEGFPTVKGMHGHFEGAFIRANVSDADVQAAVQPYAPGTGPIQARVSAYLLATQAQVVPLYTLEKIHAFDASDPKGKAFAVERLAAGVDELRDLIADAWAASGDATVGYPAVSVKDVEAGKADALDALKGLD